MSSEFWRDPPWASGNGHYQMKLRPVSEANWCPRRATAEEQHAKRELLKSNPRVVLQASENSEPAQLLLARDIERRFDLAATGALQLAEDSHARPLIASALTVPEDLCLLERDPKADKAGAESYRLTAACVCAPSYWYLPEKIGLGLQDVHAQVPGLNEALGSRIHEFFRKLPPGANISPPQLVPASFSRALSASPGKASRAKYRSRGRRPDSAERNADTEETEP